MVYLLHYLFINLYSYAFIQFLPSTFDLTATNGVLVDKPIGDASAFGGFFFVMILTMVTCFIIGGLVKRVPILGDFV